MDLVECLKENDMMLPDYERGSVIDVVRSIYQCCGYSYQEEEINPKVKQYIKNKKHMVFILSDGMGSNLIDSLSNENELKHSKVMDVVTVFPTTTGCVLPSIATAEYPAVHGMIGWYNYQRDKKLEYYTLLFKEREEKKNLEELGIKEEEIYIQESVMNQLKRKTVAVFPEKIINSNFSKFVLNENRISYTSIKEAFEKVANNIKENDDTETFTYLYLPYIDSQSHHNGVYSKEVKEVVNQIETELIKWKEQGLKEVEIIMIGDHGQIDVKEKDITMNFDKYRNYFYALPGIDFGTATYYVKEEKKEEFLTEFKKDYKDKMYIFDTKEFIQNNIFGKEQLSESMKSNLGEYISFCKKGAYFVNTTTDAENYIGKIKGSHSGFSKEEFMVPLIVMNID